MVSVVCTLFEKHYQNGVGAFINSLYQNNYRGSIYAGYKGELPDWAGASKADAAIAWEGASTLAIAEDFKVHFLPAKTDLHFVFYKPFFMLELFELIKDDVNGIAYFDPDIVIRCQWSFFETWMSHGVAVVHESMDRPATYPMRGEWKKVIAVINRQVTRNIESYINSGFCGVLKQNIEFLIVWKEVIEAAIQHYNLKKSRWGQTKDRAYPFYNADQDALNIAAMCCQSPISEMGPEGMDLIPGGFTMSHALGFPKPWNKWFIRFALMGIGPKLSDKAYWAYAASPIRLYSKTYLKIKRIKIAVAAFISRFYRRS